MRAPHRRSSRPRHQIQAICIPTQLACIRHPSPDRRSARSRFYRAPSRADPAATNGSPVRREKVSCAMRWSRTSTCLREQGRRCLADEGRSVILVRFFSCTAVFVFERAICLEDELLFLPVRRTHWLRAVSSFSSAPTRLGTGWLGHVALRCITVYLTSPPKTRYQTYSILTITRSSLPQNSTRPSRQVRRPTHSQRRRHHRPGRDLPSGPPGPHRHAPQPRRRRRHLPAQEDYMSAQLPLRPHRLQNLLPGPRVAGGAACRRQARE